ncbi:MAG: LysM peptidoglycan-binding domain-containing protein [Deltaproteobacteria bacterium]|nr:LysM peptidoglycan-binding domain-containing protein [Deltaproteobacteria bacterium]
MRSLGLLVPGLLLALPLAARAQTDAAPDEGATPATSSVAATAAAGAGAAGAGVLSVGLLPTPAEVGGAAWDEACRLPAGSPLALRAQAALFPSLGPAHFCAGCPPPSPGLASGQQGLAALDLRVAQRIFDIPLVLNDEVRELIHYFSEGSGRKHFERYLQRSGSLIPFLQRHLARAGVPRDLVFLSMIESGYSLHAYSSASAVGLWQFMKPTGLEYDLRIDEWVDERRDPEASTEAAARFLSWLHGEFDDWFLAFAAYNGGPGRVGRAITRLGDDDYWSLCRKKALPTETCRYVPKIVAAAIIGTYPEAFGFQRPAPVLDAFTYDVVEVRRPRALTDVADALGVPVEALKEANPSLRKWITPPVPVGDPPFRLKLPPGSGERFETLRESLPVASLHQAGRVHVVEAGETLWGISRRYGLSTDALIRANALADPGSIRPGQKLQIPGQSAPPPRAAALIRRGPLPEFHHVERGESLWSIARHHGLTTRTLCELNQLDCGPKVDLAVGQRLRLKPAADAPVKQAEAEPVRFHTLAAGETLWQLSRKYGVTVEEIQAWNAIEDPTDLKIGQQLRIAP